MNNEEQEQKEKGKETINNEKTLEQGTVQERWTKTITVVPDRVCFTPRRHGQNLLPFVAQLFCNFSGFSSGHYSLMMLSFAL